MQPSSAVNYLMYWPAVLLWLYAVRRWLLAAMKVCLWEMWWCTVSSCSRSLWTGSLLVHLLHTVTHFCLAGTKVGVIRYRTPPTHPPTLRHQDCTFKWDFSSCNSHMSVLTVSCNTLQLALDHLSQSQWTSLNNYSNLKMRNSENPRF